MEEQKVKMRERTPIIEGEDRVIEEDPPVKTAGHQREDEPTLSSLDAEDRNHRRKIETEKLIISSVILGVCFLIIISFAVANAYCKVDSTLFTGAFEFAKTIATTLIGYLFAVNTKEK